MSHRCSCETEHRPVGRGGFHHSSDMKGVAWMEIFFRRISAVVSEFAGDAKFVQRVIKQSAADHAVFGRVLMVERGRRDPVVLLFVFG